MGDETKERLIRQKLDYFINSKVMVHIDLLDNRFLNARIIEKESDSVYIINERKLGLMHLFVSEVVRVSEYVEVPRR